MATDELAGPDDRCRNCETPLGGVYCSVCGQAAPAADDLSLARAWRHLADALLDVDGRIFRTLRVLFLKPGQLSLEYLSGQRARSLPPLRLFLVISGLFFFLETQTVSPTRMLHGGLGRSARAHLQAVAAAGGEPYAAAMARVDDQMHLAFKATFIGIVVLNGFWFWILFRRTRPYVGQHMVTALHYSSVTMAATTVSSWIARHVGVEAWIGGAVAGLTQIYLARALERIYPGQRRSLMIAVVTTVVLDLAILLGVSLLALRIASGLPLW